jgi:trans-aconitate methyltransferase
VYPSGNPVTRETSPHWNAADYASQSQGQFKWAMSVLERLRLDGRERVLDVGCGDGKVTAEIAARLPGGSVLGIDKSVEMIALATKTWSDRGNLSFRAVDAQMLDLDERFDVGFSNAALHWVPDLQAVLSRLARLLIPGGRVFLSMGGRGTAALVLDALDRLRGDARWSGFLRAAQPPYRFRGPDEVEPMLSEAGFGPVRVELIGKPLRLADAQALTGWLRTTWMWTTEPMPDDLRPEFLAVLTDEVAPGCGRGEDDALLLPMVNLEVEATLRSNDGRSVLKYRR